MRLPSSFSDREDFYLEVARKCFETRKDRIALYSILKNYYLYGNGNIQQTNEYNKIFSHIDLLASFLFSGETTQFIIEVQDDVDLQDPNFEREKARKVQPKVNDAWHDCNLDIIFNDALIWALVYCCSFIKIIPISKRQIACYVIEPQMLGVLREDVSGLDQQEAIAHEFIMTRSEFERRTKDHGPELQERYDRIRWTEQGKPLADDIPLPLSRLIVNATQPNITGNVRTDIVAQYTFQPVVKEEVCSCIELWVWDDDANDYRVATLIDDQILLYDQENKFLPDEHPFIKICPNTMPTYFWGRSELMYLIPLQDWINTRVTEIKSILAKIADPPKTATGFSGASEEKLAAWGAPGSYLFEASPTGAKAETHAPNSPSDLFAEMKMIMEFFADISGIRDLMQGKGESGVRATSHADLLVRVGSSRVKKKAAILEDSADKCGHLILKILRRYDPTQYKTDQGMAFVANALSGGAVVKVDSHSSSPIFVEQQIDKAQLLFEAGAIDEEDLIEAVKPQNKDMLIAKLRQRKAKEAPLMQIKDLVSTAKDDEAPSILAKLKQLFGAKKAR